MLNHKFSPPRKNLLIIADTGLLLVLMYAFWHPSPNIRDAWFWLLLLVPIILILYYFFYNHIWSISPIGYVFTFFFLFTLFNYFNAPLSRSNYLAVVSRPILGFLIVAFCIRYATIHHSIDKLLYLSLIFAIIIGTLGLIAVNWDSKSAAFIFIIDRLPTLDSKLFLPDALLDFNVNEIAGAIAWLCPFMGGIIFYDWRNRFLRWIAIIAFSLLLIALILGQSRFAIAGVLLVLLFVIRLIVHRHRLRTLLYAGIIAISLLELLILLNVLPLNKDARSLNLNQRDQTTFRVRFDIWASGLQMTADNPLTGVGMSMFRTAVRQEPYIVPHYADRAFGPPHAHNEWVQIGADMGIPGILFFTALHIVLVRMLWRGWKTDQRNVQVVVVALGAGLAAHFVYGIGDAIPLWDRFAFMFWWMVGLVAAQWIITQKGHDQVDHTLSKVSLLP